MTSKDFTPKPAAGAEGVVKFQCNLIKGEAAHDDDLLEMNALRSRLFEHNLIGASADGVGFGNISCRAGSMFIISGSQTGSLPVLNASHYVLVTDYSIEGNSLTCRGQIQASSESLTHAAVYEADAGITAVVHVHNLELWQELLSKVPTTPGEVSYGTPSMAIAIQRCFREEQARQFGVVAMAGHREGVIFFGANFTEVEETIARVLKRSW